MKITNIENTEVDFETLSKLRVIFNKIGLDYKITIDLEGDRAEVIPLG